MKERSEPPIPNDLGLYLNLDQIRTIKKLEEFGWSLWFIRRPLFMETVPVMRMAASNKTAVIEFDGSTNLDHSLVIRS